MDGIDGYEVCKRLKRLPQFESIPKVFISKLTDEDDIIKAYSAGAIDYLAKPFIESEFKRIGLTYFENLDSYRQTFNFSRSFCDKIMVTFLLSFLYLQMMFNFVLTSIN